MIPHVHTLFEFISIPYENQHQTLNMKKNWPGPNQVSRVFNYATATIDPPYSHGRRKRRLKKAVSWNNCKKDCLMSVLRQVRWRTMRNVYGMVAQPFVRLHICVAIHPHTRARKILYDINHFQWACIITSTVELEIKCLRRWTPVLSKSRH